MVLAANCCKKELRDPITSYVFYCYCRSWLKYDQLQTQQMTFYCRTKFIIVFYSYCQRNCHCHCHWKVVMTLHPIFRVHHKKGRSNFRTQFPRIRPSFLFWFKIFWTFKILLHVPNPMTLYLKSYLVFHILLNVQNFIECLNLFCHSKFYWTLKLLLNFQNFVRHSKFHLFNV